MEGTYNIYRGGNAVGSGKVSREGLYWRFDCECRLDGQEICKIYADCGDERILLGTPIPEGDIFTLRTQLPANRFKGEQLKLSVNTANGEMFEKFIPVRPGEPFLHLKDLKNAVFQVRDGVSGVGIRK